MKSRLTRIREVNKGKHGHTKCLYKCECGNKKIIRQDHVNSGATKSCGCLLKEPEHTKTHGMSDTRIYKIWRNMIRRCEEISRNRYHVYGGRGIKVCERWKDFEKFYEDMGKNYNNHVKGYGESETQIDRIDNDGDYESDNCRWVTHRQQSNNTSYNRFVEYGGEKKTVAQWSRDRDIPYSTLRNRLENSNWNVEESLFGKEAINES